MHWSRGMPYIIPQILCSAFYFKKNYLKYNYKLTNTISLNDTSFLMACLFVVISFVN
jgi:hypothetical protein